MRMGLGGVVTACFQDFTYRDAQSTENLFCTDFYRLFQSTDQQIIYGRIYGFFLLGSATTPPPLDFGDRGILREKTLLGFFGIPIGQPCTSLYHNYGEIHVLSVHETRDLLSFAITCLAFVFVHIITKSLTDGQYCYTGMDN